MKKSIIVMLATLATALSLLLSPFPAVAQPAFKSKLLAEKKVTQLPPGPLFWQIENFPTLEQALAAAGPTGLAVESSGKIWLIRLGAKGAGPSAGAQWVAEVGPLPLVKATNYLLRVNEASGQPGSVTPVHTHPGSEAFYVLAGEQSIRSPNGVMRVRPGQAETGHGADVPMQVSSSGEADLRALVMFVVDAGRPFSSPAVLP